MSRSGDLPAIEGSGLGGMSLPVGMTRRALSYDDNLEAPMSTPPHDISINNLWRRPIIPDRRFSHLAEEEEVGAVSQSAVADGPSRSPGVVKAKASSIIMNSLITTIETSGTEAFIVVVVVVVVQKLQIQSMEAREERHNSSAQSTPSSTPHSSPKQQRRSWLNSTGSELSGSSNTSVDLGGGEGVVERWSVFGPRPLVQKSTSDLGSDPTAAGFALQAYRGAQKPTPMEVMKAQATRLADDPAAQKVAPPKMEIPTVEGRRQGARAHKLKPRDMNILTPSGF
uniref:putative monooxygenase p33MONOX n=1 Tax=Centroberyx gerrardi TaxID=166262 RepID=UPI003AAD9D5D